MDGIGAKTTRFGNAVAWADTPNLDWLKTHSFYTLLNAHGEAVGLPSEADMGNSEVGHNAIGAGRIFAQGAKLVNEAFGNGSIFMSPTWQSIKKQLGETEKTLHLIGLLSDGNVHSHQDHLHLLME